MQSKTFAHHATRLVSNGRFADTATGYHAKAGGRIRRQRLPIGKKTALGQALTFFPVGPEIRAGLDTAGLWKNRSLAGGRHDCRICLMLLLALPGRVLYDLLESFDLL